MIWIVARIFSGCEPGDDTTPSGDRCSDILGGICPNGISLYPVKWVCSEVKCIPYPIYFRYLHKTNIVVSTINRVNFHISSTTIDTVSLLGYVICPPAEKLILLPDKLTSSYIVREMKFYMFEGEHSGVGFVDIHHIGNI